MLSAWGPQALAFMPGGTLVPRGTPRPAAHPS